MFYTVAKLVGFFLTPPNVLVFAVVAAAALLWTPYRRIARALTTFGVLVLAACAFTPLPTMLLRPLEQRFPQPDIAQPPTGLIVLGGVTDEVTTAARNQVTLTEGAERLTEAVVLLRRFPAIRLVFSGGSARPGPGALTEADVARRFWVSLGVPADRMTFEDRSRDTWENGVFTKELVQPKPGETWLLVTSASHMPRAIGIFRRIGFPVVPYPVDFHTTGTDADFRGLRGAADAFGALAMASHEWIGLVAYRLADKTSALFPGP